MALPKVMLIREIMMFDLIRPNTMVMALPKMGIKAKKPIQAPCPAMNLWAWSNLSFLTCKYFSIQTVFPNLPTP